MGPRTFALTLVVLTSCTSAAPWGVEGTAGAPCFPDRTCDPGLGCVNGVCASAPGIDAGPLPDDGVRRDRGSVDESTRRDLAPCASPPPPPVVLPYSKTTVLERVVVRGSAPGATELAVSGSGGSQTVKVVADLFCVELQLKKNAQNGFELRARDAAGCESPPVFVGIVQAAAGPVNLLLGLPAKSSGPPDSGSLAMLTDGQTTAAVKFSFFDSEVSSSTCDNHETIWFDLGATRTIDQLAVRYPQKSGFKYFLTCWEILVSNAASPAAPDPKHPDWTSIAMQQSGAASQLSVPIPGTQARHLALVMYEDGGTGLWENFELTEMEAWGVPAPPPEESCP
jgi:hypothetical protein